MPFLVKFKGLFSKKDKDDKSKQVSVRTVSSPRTNYASLIALATAARGEDAEQFFPRILLQASHHQSVTRIRAPLSRGILVEWLQHLRNQGAKPTQLNSFLRIEYSQEDQSQDTSPPSTSFIEEIPDTKDVTVSQNFEPSSVDVGAPVSFAPSVRTTENESQVGTPSTVALPAATRPALKDFAVIKRLGAGSYGTVFLARHGPSGIRVALKAISKVPHNHDGSTRNIDWSTGILAEREQRTPGPDTATLMDTTLEEFFALHRLRGEKGMLQMHAAFHDLRYFYFATAFHTGGDLQAQLEIHHAFTADRVRFYAADLLLGLETLRKHGIVHRDLKPANLLIGSDGHLVMADFGLARSFETHMIDVEKAFFTAEEAKGMIEDCCELTQLGCGTEYYIAPEVFRNEAYSYAVDVWAVGVIVYQLLFGRLPWETLAWKHKNDIGRTVLKEQVVVSDAERALLDLDPQAECFFLAALDKDQYTRPTPAQLKSHEFFHNFDWERHSSSESPACWIPGARCIKECSPGASGPLINGTRAYEPDEDFLPLFSFLSPQLSPDFDTCSSPTFTPSPRLASSLPALSPQATSSLWHTQASPAVSLSVPDAVSPLLSPLSSTADSTTLVGSPIAPSSFASSTAANDSPPLCDTPRGSVFTRFKKWAHKVWHSWRSRSSRK